MVFMVTAMQAALAENSSAEKVMEMVSVMIDQKPADIRAELHAALQQFRQCHEELTAAGAAEDGQEE
jgi:hypothetical protein